MLLDQVADRDDQTGGRATHQQRRAGHQPDEETPDDPGNDAALGLDPTCDGDADAEGEGDQEHDNGCEKIREGARRGAGGRRTLAIGGQVFRLQVRRPI